jgi:hypothetical protein
MRFLRLLVGAMQRDHIQNEEIQQLGKITQPIKLGSPVKNVKCR